MTHFDGTGNVTIYFALFEMQIFRRNIVKEKLGYVSIKFTVT